MLKGYPLRDYTWKDWVLMIVSSGLALQFIVAFLATMFSDIDPNNMEAVLAQVERITLNAAVYGTIISLPLSLMVIHWRKIPIFNRKQLSKSEWFIVPGLSKKDWSFLVKYIPISFILYRIGSVILFLIFGEMEAVNQEAIVSILDYLPTWIMFIMIVIVAPIN